MFRLHGVNRGSTQFQAELHCSSAAVAAVSGALGKLWCQFLLQMCPAMTQRGAYALGLRLRVLWVGGLALKVGRGPS